MTLVAALELVVELVGSSARVRQAALCLAVNASSRASVDSAAETGDAAGDGDGGGARDSLGDVAAAREAQKQLTSRAGGLPVWGGLQVCFLGFELGLQLLRPYGQRRHQPYYGWRYV